jgi:hypothetical protein
MDAASAARTNLPVLPTVAGGDSTLSTGSGSLSTCDGGQPAAVAPGVACVTDYRLSTAATSPDGRRGQRAVSHHIDEFSVDSDHVQTIVEPDRVVSRLLVSFEVVAVFPRVGHAPHDVLLGRLSAVFSEADTVIETPTATGTEDERSVSVAGGSSHPPSVRLTCRPSA